MGDRAQRRRSFDAIAADYDEVRTRYPAELFDSLVELARLPTRARLLEIGCGPGVATAPLAERGYPITAIELGTELASLARQRLAAHANVEVIEASFDDWEPPSWAGYDLVFAASSWHWLDPDTRYERAHRHLRLGGALAFWSAAHVLPSDGDPFFTGIQEVYDEIGAGRTSDQGFARPGELRTQRAEIDANGLFETVDVRHFTWERTYDAEAYVRLLGTFSDHLAMEPWQRNRVFAEVRRRLAARPDGLLRRHFGAVLHVARAL